MSRRWKIVRVTDEVFRHMLTTGAKPALVVDGGLPPTATLDNARYDPIFGRLELRFHDESFSLVPEGCCPPDLTPTLRMADPSEVERAAFDRGRAAAEAAESATLWLPNASAVVEGSP